MTTTYETVHLRLVEAVPEFQPMLVEHLADHHEVLPHLLFGDLTRFTMAAHAAGDVRLSRRVLEFLATEFAAGDPQVDELIAVSFVENVGPWDDAHQEFVSTWPDRLREEARRQREWKPPS